MIETFGSSFFKWTEKKGVKSLVGMEYILFSLGSFYGDKWSSFMLLQGTK